MLVKGSELIIMRHEFTPRHDRVLSLVSASLTPVIMSNWLPITPLCGRGSGGTFWWLWRPTKPLTWQISVWINTTVMSAVTVFNTSRSRLYRHNFRGDIFKRILLNDKYGHLWKFNHNLFLKFQMKISQYWSRQWLGAAMHQSIIRSCGTQATMS